MTDPIVADFRPSHVVPKDGMRTWSAPDGMRPSVPLDPLLPVQVVDRQGDWAHVLCSNGWSTWVDGRLLVSVPQHPPIAGQPPARTADPRQLLRRVEEQLGRYRQAVEERISGETDGETFRQRTRGLRAGVVVDGEAVWLYDAQHERWSYCDGVSLKTFAPSGPPSVDRGPAASGDAQDTDTGGPGDAGTGIAAAQDRTRAVEREETRVPEGDAAPVPEGDETRAGNEEETRAPEGDETLVAEPGGPSRPADPARAARPATHPPTQVGDIR